MGKTRNLFSKIRAIQGTFHAKMGIIKDRIYMDLTEAEDIKKKYLHDPDNHDGGITHLESDILKSEVKWALGSFTRIKLVEVIEFQLSYFKS